MPTRSTAATFQRLDRPRANDCSGLARASIRGTRLLDRWPISACGCTGPSEYIHNGFKVGPNYCPPGAPVADAWIDAADKRVRSDSDDLSQWWRVFNDPQLDALIHDAYRQNLTLREAGFRVLAAGPIGHHRHRQPVPPIAIRVRRLLAHDGQHRDGQQHRLLGSSSSWDFRYAAKFQPVGLRVRARLGVGLLGALPPCR